jgi:hypothetical protein
MSPLIKIRWVDILVDYFSQASHEESLYPFPRVRLRDAAASLGDFLLFLALCWLAWYRA